MTPIIHSQTVVQKIEEMEIKHIKTKEIKARLATCWRWLYELYPHLSGCRDIQRFKRESLENPMAMSAVIGSRPYNTTPPPVLT